MHRLSRRPRSRKIFAKSYFNERMNTRRRGAHRSRAARVTEQHRQHLIAEAARIMADEDVKDFQIAKRKAAERLNLPVGKFLPANEEIEAALRKYLALFHGAAHHDHVQRLRQVALEAMRFLQDFQPRLVGAVLAGTATASAAVQLHVTADTPEDVALLLTEAQIPFDQSERRVRFGGERFLSVPVFHFVVNDAGAAPDTTIELWVFGVRTVRELPLSPVDGRPMQRADVTDVERLLGAG